MASVFVHTRDKPALVEVNPHRWALGFWGRSFRQLGRRWILTRHAQRLCQPLELTGLEHLSELRTSAIIIANHTSHFDTLIALSILPPRLYSQTAVAAAADRFYTQRLKGAWYSLRYNAFPITRGGGRGALTYSEWLLQTGRSLLIFPEGTRSRTGKLLPFRAGPAILALKQRVPIVPVYISGAANILPPGTKVAQPAAVRVEVGEPLRVGEDDSVAEATAKMEAAMQDLANQQLVPSTPTPVLV